MRPNQSSRSAAGIYERIVPGAAAFVIARERYIDDFLLACQAEGLDQVVILGAGYDTRACSPVATTSTAKPCSCGRA